MNMEEIELLESVLEDLSSARGSDYSGAIALKKAISELRKRPNIQAVMPNAKVVEMHNEDGSRTWHDIVYACPVCGWRIFEYKGVSSCRECGKYFDWGDHKPTIKAQYSVEW